MTVLTDTLSDAEMLRYHRQISLHGFDIDKQERLKQSAALIIGLGGLGCAASQYLVAAGIGKVTLVDFDTVSLSNLQRQILHHDAQIGEPKVSSAAKALRQINPHVQIETANCALHDVDLDTVFAQHDLVLDCTDNVDARNQLNALCAKHKMPLVSGAAIRMEGQLAVFTYQKNEPCYACLSRLFGTQTLSCVEAGVMSPLVGIIGAMQALEAIKLVTDFGTPRQGKLLLFDAKTLQFRDVNLPQDPNCAVCQS